MVVSLQTQGSPAMTILVTLNGQPIQGGGITMSDGSAVLTPPGGAAAYEGAVTGLSGNNITADLSDGHGDRITLAWRSRSHRPGRPRARY